jgi:hypothetical protein
MKKKKKKLTCARFVAECPPDSRIVEFRGRLILVAPSIEPIVLVAGKGTNLGEKIKEAQ